MENKLFPLFAFVFFIFWIFQNHSNNSHNFKNGTKMPISFCFVKCPDYYKLARQSKCEVCMRSSLN